MTHSSFTDGQQHVLTHWVDGKLGIRRGAMDNVGRVTWITRPLARTAKRHRTHEFPDPIEERLPEQSPRVVSPHSGWIACRRWRWRDAEVECTREEPPGVSRRERTDAVYSRAGESLEAFRARLGYRALLCSRLGLRWYREWGRVWGG